MMTNIYSKVKIFIQFVFFFMPTSIVFSQTINQFGESLLDKRNTATQVNIKMSGYTDKISVTPGDTLHFKTSTSAKEFSATIMRFGKKTDKLKIINNIPGKIQNVPDFSWSHGCGWMTTLTFVIPLNFQPGIYSVRFKDSNNSISWTTFIVKPVHNGRTPLAVIVATNTWNAYNNWGGKSVYHPKNDFSYYVSYDRPNPQMVPNDEEHNHTAAAEVLLLSWLEKNGYDYDTFTDVDLHSNSSLLNKYKTLILGVHTEYWSFQMMNHLKQFLNNGGNLIYLGGNGLYWKVTFDSKNRIMECRKDGSTHTHTGERGGLWRELEDAEAKLLGIEYTEEGYNTFAPYKIIKASHWIFKGTDLMNGDLIGKSGLNGVAASGWETDKIDKKYSPSNIQLLAKGTNPGEGGADMIYYDHPGGGFVFSVGSLSFVNSLIIDPTLTKIVNNALGSRVTTNSNQINYDPFTFELNQNYPNPFNPATKISYKLPRPAEVQLKIYDLLGENVATLVNSFQTSGDYTISFDGSNLSSGMYFYILETGKQRIVKKMMLVK